MYTALTTFIVNHSFKFVLERSLHQVSFGNFVTYDLCVSNLQKFWSCKAAFPCGLLEWAWRIYLFWGCYWGLMIFKRLSASGLAANKNGTCRRVAVVAKAHEKQNRWQVVYLKICYPVSKNGGDSPEYINFTELHIRILFKHTTTVSQTGFCYVCSRTASHII